MTRRGSCIEFIGTGLPTSVYFLEEFALQLNQADFLSEWEKSLLASLLGRLLMQSISSDQVWTALELQLERQTFDRVRGLAIDLKVNHQLT